MDYFSDFLCTTLPETDDRADTPKGRGNGYILELGGKKKVTCPEIPKIFPEMRALNWNRMWHSFCY